MSAPSGEAVLRRRRALYRAVFDTADGRLVLADLARAGHLDQPTYVRGDAMESAYREGRRSVVLMIRALLSSERTTDEPEGS